MLSPKRNGVNLAIATFRKKNGSTYLVFRTPKGSYNVFQEVDAKAAALDYLGKKITMLNTRNLWASIWK